MILHLTAGMFLGMFTMLLILSLCAAAKNGDRLAARKWEE